MLSLGDSAVFGDLVPLVVDDVAPEVEMSPSMIVVTCAEKIITKISHSFFVLELIKNEIKKWIRSTHKQESFRPAP